MEESEKEHLRALGKDQLEKEKLIAEISKVQTEEHLAKLPWYRSARYLTFIIPTLLATLTFFITQCQDRRVTIQKEQLKSVEDTLQTTKDTIKAQRVRIVNARQTLNLLEIKSNTQLQLIKKQSDSFDRVEIEYKHFSDSLRNKLNNEIKEIVTKRYQELNKLKAEIQVYQDTVELHRKELIYREIQSKIGELNVECREALRVFMKDAESKEDSQSYQLWIEMLPGSATQFPDTLTIFKYSLIGFAAKKVKRHYSSIYSILSKVDNNPLTEMLRSDITSIDSVCDYMKDFVCKSMVLKSKYYANRSVTINKAEMEMSAYKEALEILRDISRKCESSSRIISICIRNLYR